MWHKMNHFKVDISLPFSTVTVSRTHRPHQVPHPRVQSSCLNSAPPSSFPAQPPRPQGHPSLAGRGQSLSPTGQLWEMHYAWQRGCWRREQDTHSPGIMLPMCKKGAHDGICTKKYKMMTNTVSPRAGGGRGRGEEQVGPRSPPLPAALTLNRADSLHMQNTCRTQMEKKPTTKHQHRQIN